MERKPVKKRVSRKSAKKSRSPARSFGISDLSNVAETIEGLAGDLRRILEMLAVAHPDWTFDCPPPPEGIRGRRRSRVASVKPSAICQGC